VKPSKLTLILLLVWSLLGLAASFSPDLLKTWNMIGIFIGVGLLLDAFGVYLEPNIRIERHLSHNLSVNSWTQSKLHIRNIGNRTYKLSIYELHPAHFLSRDLPINVVLEPGKFADAEYRLFPSKRGDGEFPGLHVKVQSKLGLWIRQRTYHLPHHVKIYPNFSEVTKFALLATDNNLSQMGVKYRQRRGQGMEFHQLREYREGDSLRQIDWKATSRLQKLISREYQDERDQRIVFLLDCGRRMRAQDGNLSHFDQALNALLLLSYVALRQGDSVSFHTFGGHKRLYLAGKGVHSINAILNQLYDLHSTVDVADYETAAKELLTHQRKRSLIVVLTNARDEDFEDLSKALRLLRSRHLVVLANLREEILDQTLNVAPQDLQEALRYSAVLNYLESRNRIHNNLRESGVITLNVTAEQLPISIVNRYLEIKSSNIL